MMIPPSFLASSAEFKSLFSAKPPVILQGPIWIYFGKLIYIQHPDQHPFWIYKIESNDGVTVFAPAVLSGQGEVEESFDKIATLILELMAASNNTFMPLEILILLKIYYSKPIQVANNIIVANNVRFFDINDDEESSVDELSILRICEYIITSNDRVEISKVKQLLNDPTNLKLFEIPVKKVEPSLQMMDKLVRKKQVNYSKLPSQHYLEKAILFRAFALSPTCELEDIKKETRHVIIDHCQNTELIDAYIQYFGIDDLGNFELYLLMRTIEFVEFMYTKVVGREKPTKVVEEQSVEMVQVNRELAYEYQYLSKKGLKKQRQEKQVIDLLNKIYVEFANMEMFLGSPNEVYTGTFRELPIRKFGSGVLLCVPYLFRAYKIFIYLTQLKHNDGYGMESLGNQFTEYFTLIFGEMEFKPSSDVLYPNLDTDYFQELHRLSGKAVNDKKNEINNYIKLQQYEYMLMHTKRSIKNIRKGLSESIQNVIDSLPNELTTNEELQAYKEFIQANHLFICSTIGQFKQLHQKEVITKAWSTKVEKLMLPFYLTDGIGGINRDEIYKLESERLSAFILQINKRDFLDGNPVQEEYNYLLLLGKGLLQKKWIHYADKYKSKLNDLDKVWKGVQTDLNNRLKQIPEPDYDEWIRAYFKKIANEITKSNLLKIDGYLKKETNDYTKLYEHFETLNNIYILSGYIKSNELMELAVSRFDDYCYFVIRTMLSFEITTNLNPRTLYYMSKFPLVFAYDQLIYDKRNSKQGQELSDEPGAKFYISGNYTPADLNRHTIERINKIEDEGISDLLTSLYIQRFRGNKLESVVTDSEIINILNKLKL